MDDTAGLTLNDEAEAFLWVTPSEALALDLNAPTKQLIEAWLVDRTQTDTRP